MDRRCAWLLGRARVLMLGSMSATPAPPHPLATSVLLAAVAGFVDTVGFIALFGLFTAHVTGNFVLIGAALAGSGDGLLAKLLALPVFMLVVATVALLLRHPQASPRAIRIRVLLAQAALGRRLHGLRHRPAGRCRAG